MPINNLALSNRPESWAEVVGQPIPVQVLTQSIAINEIKPAYLFMGESGCGKTSCGLLLAKRLVCDDPNLETQDPCGLCRPCQLVGKGICDDVFYVDGAVDRSIDFVRVRLKPYLATAPLGGKYRIIILDEVHQLGKDAVSALLTLLERMPNDHPKSVVIMCTTEGDAVDGAIKNRCLPLNFAPIPPEQIATVMAEKTGLPLDVLTVLAEEAGGSFRTMWSYFEVWQYTNEALTEDLIMRIVNGISRRERMLLFTDLGQGHIDKVSSRWKKWLAGGARPKVLTRLLLRDVAEIAAKYPGSANWKKYLGLLSASRPESAMLPALYTMCGLPLDSQDGEMPRPAEGQSTLLITGPLQVTSNAISLGSLSAKPGYDPEQDALLMRLVLLGS